ncbi:hypothetical protein AAG747_05705 [Rapidithrix thailandica]|uniref:DUF2726 domain-containing protein n=1 Tax=Rapidithrix thailandica TaxID=413964 RepID=A0AAW9RWE8_9BACT
MMTYTEVDFAHFEKILTNILKIDPSLFDIHPKTKNYKRIIPFRQIFQNNGIKISYINAEIDYEDCSDLKVGLSKMLTNLFGEVNQFDHLLIYRSDSMTTNKDIALILKTHDLTHFLSNSYKECYTSKYIFDVTMDDIYFYNLDNGMFYGYEHPGVLYTADLN